MHGLGAGDDAHPGRSGDRIAIGTDSMAPFGGAVFHGNMVWLRKLAN
jgi:hypothetical protein